MRSLAGPRRRTAAARGAAHRDRAVGETCPRWIAVRADAPARRRAGVPDAAAARDGSYWNLVAPYALASGVLGSRDAGARGAPLPAHPWLALPRRRARRSVLALRRTVGLDRARPGVRAERGAVPRGARRARPARARPLRASRSGADARHIRRRRGVLAFADRAGVLSLDVPAAEQRRQRRIARDAAAARGQRAPEGRGLQLAYATPRAWLAPGKRIAVDRLPTGFGPLSYTLVSHARSVSATISVPRIAEPLAVAAAAAAGPSADRVGHRRRPAAAARSTAPPARST